MRLDESVTSAPGWTVVIPVKVLDAAKSRLAGLPVTSGDLALAFFEDTLAAVSAARRPVEVIVATADDRVRVRAHAAGAAVVDDAQHPGIAAAAAWAAEHRRSSGGVAVIVSDLPALSPDALDAALALAEGHRTSFLADTEGIGTTMWFANPGQAIRPRFGPDSRAAHVAAGDADLVDLHPESADRLARARCDVDTRPALDRAQILGLGRATAEVLGSTPP